MKHHCGITLYHRVSRELHMYSSVGTRTEPTHLFFILVTLAGNGSRPNLKCMVEFTFLGLNCH